MKITIYHNPACGTSRNVLALIRHAGIEPTVIEYLKNPPDAATLRAMLKAAGATARDWVREKGSPFAELQLGSFEGSEDEWLALMVQHPSLINRPLVVTERATRLCRPSEAVLELLPQGALPPFTKEDGEVVIDTGRRL